MDRRRKQNERNRREKEERNPLYAGSLPECPQHLKLSQSEPQNQKLSVDLPCEWQGLRYLSHCSLSSRVYVGRQLEIRSKSLNLNPCEPVWDVDVPSGGLTSAPTREFRIPETT